LTLVANSQPVKAQAAISFTSMDNSFIGEAAPKELSSLPQQPANTSPYHEAIKQANMSMKL
jgi:hypothetical protein